MINNKTKKCFRCKEDKPETEFGKYSRSKDGLQPNCKICKREYDRKYWLKIKHKDRYTQNKADYRKRMESWLKDYKISRGCSSCGFNVIPQALHLHHVDPSTKTIQPADMPRRGWSVQRMKTELEKCIVLCGNCHAIEHYT